MSRLKSFTRVSTVLRPTRFEYGKGHRYPLLSSLFDYGALIAVGDNRRKYLTAMEFHYPLGGQKRTPGQR
jgi:hypothetical protein